MPETTLSFTNEQFQQIQELYRKNPNFKKNLTQITNAWRTQQITTKNAVDLIKKELEKA